ncbi:MAG TPA: peroxidase family protein, partial [Planctomycetota bacterium]|nr:peroxidase family protein [Planctomycetota bacterium]
SSAEIVNRLASIYVSVDDIDPWVGALSEDHLDGAMVGELLFTVIREQFTAARDGDRFFYRTAPPIVAIYADSQKLSSIIRENTPIRGEVQDNAFIVP